ncbi:MAG: bidirectional hydrogenase complex protein HoxE [Aulosira sp. ZfuVER01]|nr:bidirectional hydrogenase complex protein HoxE [Aulosira sp. ZfuVER01]MDZ8002807.1 bidirectional hydrogenase complex protein HoxE [Aulosira sp. DedVER01a]MDZ8054375.1 bidirectional hydrogenase complex protein HoxE [Aulosira sp. ZfuCHP01]
MNSASAAQTDKTTKAPLATHASGDKRFKMLDATIKRYQYQQDALIEVLHKAQELFGYLETDVLYYVAHSLKLPPSRVYGVATFYHLFSLAPSGAHTCVVCTGTACYVKGAQAILTEVEQSAHIHAGETTPDSQLSLLTARCLGACGIAPAVVFDGTVLGNQTADSVCDRIKGWLKDGSS